MCFTRSMWQTSWPIAAGAAAALEAGLPGQPHGRGRGGRHRMLGRLLGPRPDLVGAKGHEVSGLCTAGVPKPMLIMGGGYDPCEDADPASRAPATRARATACTSSMPTPAPCCLISRPIAAWRPTCSWFRTTRYGLAEWRTWPTWAATSIASMPADVGLAGCRAVSIGSRGLGHHQDRFGRLRRVLSDGLLGKNRKFMFSSTCREAGTASVNIMVGSGDREKPLERVRMPTRCRTTSS